MSLEQTESQNPLNIDTNEQGGLHIEEKSESWQHGVPRHRLMHNHQK